MKVSDDFFAVWGGISGVQHFLPALLDAGLDSPLLAQLASANPARRFRLPDKGRLEIGGDADVVLVELGEPREVAAEELLCRHPQSPYAGRELRARVRRTILRGATGAARGRFLKPGPASRAAVFIAIPGSTPGVRPYQG